LTIIVLPSAMINNSLRYALKSVRYVHTAIVNCQLLIVNYYSPMDCNIPLRAVLTGLLSGSFAEGSPSQSQR